MELHVVINGRKDLAGQLYQQLRSAIESGRLAAGTQLPPSRLLAEQLGISRKTISDTYTQLTYENYLTGIVGKGTYVNIRTSALARKQSHSELASREIIERWRNLPTFLRHPAPDASLRYDFIGGATSKGLFPRDDWRRCTAHALRQVASVMGFYSQAEGLPALRSAIARHIAFSRGVICQDQDVVVCNGAQQALDLIGRVLIQPGSLVAMEDPGYPPARLLFASHGAEVVGVPVDGEGIEVASIPEGTRLIYVTPSHQFPLGMPMSQARREALLARAHALGAIIIEDDYDSEFRYEGRPTDSLQSLDQHGLVAYVGTFSKTLLPELRLGYAILPPAILEAVIRAKQLTDLHTSTLPQWALAKFIDEGCLLKHIRRCHTVYAGRRERILARVADDLSPWLEAVPSTAGFHMVLLCKVEVDVSRLIERAKDVEVGLYGLSEFFYQQAPRAGLFMGFGAIDTLDIDTALDRLRDLLQQVA
ncbi:PLP-dependent aminotransferase family protein [Pseudomonas sp. Irchel s3a18]|uniref:MocR-like pyridoxine biosynthesis transcription factor PdxR n=1 Tax=Pseudomonas sp. Irchel s3a18 TaxID=2009053 RepID=UPI000BA2C3B9|nr:PLP-dependent aminotransferase family protein [Pseudomonas sp. Irchel s3a18]